MESVTLGMAGGIVDALLVVSKVVDWKVVEFFSGERESTLPENWDAGDPIRARRAAGAPVIASGGVSTVVPW